ncbi:hypothetical protein BDZ85DRAFT_295837 [Elsinoe ampelina]|uniref:Zn(2)-C6 fungal-type domain-containing protein n=1 Tax=Elsinoe ampelina TaxID=302913 RepID=A0A6A6GD98_9PEZI|nr:hypothetical protein BDZ85DRAFT_295837 [Elsinoe ampelina]
MDNGEDTNREQNVSRRRQRNDDGDEVPKAKRSRVSRACDQCRLSRDKCDGKSPCQTCTASGRDCSYTTNPKKRGIQPGYIRTLESALALLFQRDTGAQKFLSGQLSKGPLRQYVKDGNHSEQLHTIWTNSSVCKQIDAILSGSPSNDFDTSEDLQDGPMSERHASLPEIAATDHSDPYTAAGLATTFHQTSHGNTLNGDAQAPIDLPTNFWNLVDHYYAFTHNWLPISEKNDVLKTAYLYPLRGADPAITQSGTHAELWAIVALSSRQSEPSSSAHRRYTELARSFIPDHDGRYDKGHVRAQILMSLLCVGDGEAAAAWIKIGLASRILTHLGLHRSASGRDTKDRHLVLGCLAVDNMIGLYLDLPGHLSAIYDLRRARVDEDGLEEWTPWQSPSQPGSNAGNGLLNREPGRCLSTFNALVDALRQPEIEPVRHVALSKTPHQLHLELVKVWASYRTARVTHQECLDRMSLGTTTTPEMDKSAIESPRTSDNREQHTAIGRSTISLWLLKRCALASFAKLRQLGQSSVNNQCRVSTDCLIRSRNCSVEFRSITAACV